MRIAGEPIAPFAMGRGLRNGRTWAAAACLLLGSLFAVRGVEAQTPPPGAPGLAVTGHGVVSAAPDQVVLRLGAAVEARQAELAQTQASEIMRRVVEALRARGLPPASLTTVGLSLSPVYQQQPERPIVPGAPRVAGYRALQMLQIVLDDVGRTGEILDAALAAGANQVESPVFRLADEAASRREALGRAVRDARGKAEALAQAMGVRLAGVLEATEGEVSIIRPGLQAPRMAVAGVATPVEPGQVRIEGTVTIRYRITDSSAPL